MWTGEPDDEDPGGPRRAGRPLHQYDEVAAAMTSLGTPMMTPLVTSHETRLETLTKSKHTQRR
jgi:hypothetical protein